MTHTAIPTKLRDGSWGARIQYEDAHQVCVGDTVTITTRAGKSWDAVVSRVLWADGRAAVVETTRIQPGTQAAAVAAVAPEMLALGKTGPGGHCYKPDASPTELRCARCGRPAMWIAGAGEALCHRHQDDY